jgi:hypothetical protein
MARGVLMTINKKIAPSVLRKQARQLIESGHMPSLDEVLAAVAETRATFLPLIAAARAEKRQF